ncbi:hypothetical protein ADUPG1_010192 [Aduncisulcus paluster]|uniref:Uncharacterized protein n=1 Tax=Aduncisulcus paluster TaxID=2918883 RepID=A0ABQ5JQA4_9EUKA|nr:hypothetical protein ADUPG1_010192 [Aduncisulcus paluster]
MYTDLKSLSAGNDITDHQCHTISLTTSFSTLAGPHIRPQRQCPGLLKADVEILVDTSYTTAVIKTTEEEIEEAQC